MAPHSSTLAWQIPVAGSQTERLHFHFSLSRIGEGNGNPLQCSCLENPRVGEPGGLPSMGSHRVGHDWSDLAAAAATDKYSCNIFKGFPGGLVVRESTCQCRRYGFDPLFGKILWRRKWQPAAVFLPRKSHGQRSLVDCNPCVTKSQTWLSTRTCKFRGNGMEYLLS